MARVALSFCLIITSVLYWVIGISCIGSAFAALLRGTFIIKLANIADDPNDFEGSSTVETTVYLIMVSGIFLFTMALLGCGFTFKPALATFIAYVLGVSFAMLLQITSVILAAKFKANFDDHGKEYLTNLVNEKYYGPFDRKHELSKAFDEFQLTFECCGVESHEIFLKAPLWNKTWIYKKENKVKEALIPATCCEIKGELLLSDFNTIDDFQGRLRDPNCPFTLKKKHVDGCYTSMDKWYDLIYVIFLGTGGSVIFVELVGMIALVFFMRSGHIYDDTNILTRNIYT